MSLIRKVLSLFQPAVFIPHLHESQEYEVDLADAKLMIERFVLSEEEYNLMSQVKQNKKLIIIRCKTCFSLLGHYYVLKDAYRWGFIQ